MRDSCVRQGRTQSKRPKDRDESSSEEDERDDSEGDSDGGDHDAAKQSGRQSLKSSNMTKVLSPLIGYGTDYALFQFVYDLHMWTILGAKKHVRGGEVPLRVLLKGASFSPLYWRLRHHALIDTQRQLGYPTLFYTMWPYEWSFPYHQWMLDEMAKDLRGRLHLPVGETMHLANALMELAQGWLMGTNRKHAAKKSDNWTQHIIKSSDGKRTSRIPRRQAQTTAKAQL